MKTLLGSGIDRLNPFDQVGGELPCVELRDRFPFAIPLAGSLFDDPLQLIESSRAKSEIVMMRSVEEAGFLRHETTQPREQHRHFAREGFKRRERARLRDDDVGSRHVTMDVFQKSKRSRS